MSLPAIPIRGATSPCEAFGCSACCHDNEMLLTEDDAARIRAVAPSADFYERTDDGFLQLLTKDAPPSAGWDGGKGLPVAKDAPPAPCVFLDPTGRCSIHDARPEGCRLYPAVWDAATILDTEYCPHTGGFVLSGQVAAAVRRLAERLERERRVRLASRSG